MVALPTGPQLNGRSPAAQVFVLTLVHKHGIATYRYKYKLNGEGVGLGVSGGVTALCLTLLTAAATGGAAAQNTGA